MGRGPTLYKHNYYLSWVSFSLSPKHVCIFPPFWNSCWGLCCLPSIKNIRLSTTFLGFLLALILFRGLCALSWISYLGLPSWLNCRGSSQCKLIGFLTECFSDFLVYQYRESAILDQLLGILQSKEEREQKKIADL